MTYRCTKKINFNQKCVLKFPSIAQKLINTFEKQSKKSLTVIVQSLPFDRFVSMYCGTSNIPSTDPATVPLVTIRYVGSEEVKRKLGNN